MPPSPKVTKEQLINAALEIASKQGFDKVTAREVGKSLGISSRPVFTYYESMNDLKADVWMAAYNRYLEYTVTSNDDERTFQHAGRQVMRFVKEEPALFRLLCFPTPENPDASTIGSFSFFEKNYDRFKERIEEDYGLTGEDSKSVFRNMWIFTLGVAMLVQSGSCPYSDEQLDRLMSEISLSSCRLYLDFPGLSSDRSMLPKAFHTTFSRRNIKEN